MNNLLRYVIGWKRYKAEIENPARYAGNLMSLYPEEVFDVKVTEDGFYFSCLIHKRKKVLMTDFLNDTEVFEISSSGLVSLLHKHGNRIGLVAGIILSMSVIWIQSCLVWEIRISGNNTVSDEEITETLRNIGFYAGVYQTPEMLVEIKNKFILEDNRISWLSINMSGNVAFVEVKERDMKPESDFGTVSMSGIVATKDCVVILPEPLSGTSLVAAGDTVLKGQLLISPIVQGKDGADYIVGASGAVFARTIEDFCVVVPYYNRVAKKTGRVGKEITISFLGKSVEFKSPFPSYGRYFGSDSKETVKVFKGIEIPMKKLTREKREYILSEQIITPQAARKRAYNRMYSKIAEALPDAEILSTSFTEAEEEDCFVLRCRIECIRDVGDKTPES